MVTYIFSYRSFFLNQRLAHAYFEILLECLLGKGVQITELLQKAEKVT